MGIHGAHGGVGQHGARRGSRQVPRPQHWRSNHVRERRESGRAAVVQLRKLHQGLESDRRYQLLPTTANYCQLLYRALMNTAHYYPLLHTATENYINVLGGKPSECRYQLRPTTANYSTEH